MYFRGKENRVNILKSIDEGPFKIGTLRETLTKGTEGALHLGPEQPRVYSDLTSEEKDMYNADIRATNILLQGLPKDIYSHINHYTDTKDIWDNVKMLLEGSELTKEDRKSQLTIYNPSTTLPSTYVQPHLVDTTQLDSRLSPTDNLIENLTNTLALLTHSYKTYLPQTNNQLRTSSNPRNQATIQDGKVVIQNVQGRHNRGHGNNASGAGAAGYGELRTESHRKELHSTQATTELRVLQIQDVVMQAQENGVTLDEEHLLFIAVRQDNVVDANTYKSEVHDHDHYQDAVCEHHEVHEMHDDVQPNYIVDSHTGYMSDSNMIPYDQYVKDNAVEVVQSDVSFVPNDAYMMILNDMHESSAQHIHVTTQTKVVDKSLTAELATYKEQVELYERRARFELTKREQKIDEQLRIVITNRNIKEENLKKELHSVKMQLASTINHNKSMPLATRAPLCLTHAKQVQPALYNGHEIIKTDHVLAIMHNSEDTLKIAEITRKKMNEKMKKPPNNRKFHLDYLKHLKESVATFHEIVEEAKVERPLDRSVASACLYTKHSQELLEYVIGTCLKDFNKRDKKQATIPLNRKKQVTFADQCETSNTNIQKHVEQQITQKTNVLVLPSTRVDSCIDASGSKPRSNTKKNRMSPAKSVNKKTVEDSSPISLICKNQIVLILVLALSVVQIMLWYLDSGCSKHMTGDRSRLKNFVKKFIGMVRFGNGHFNAIRRYGDYVIGDSVIPKVYYVEGLGHNLFSVRQFCDSDLEVAFKKHSCYVCDTDGVELISGSRGSNLYTISVEDMMKSSPICLLSKASKTKSWLWHHRLNHLNFGTINDLARKDLVRGLPRLKFEKIIYVSRVN
nr:integrase, catalytic region, zinc finger, CCHC-type, peptidase aspartic, catalytic [Tanacetum cinerariifolium]